MEGNGVCYTIDALWDSASASAEAISRPPIARSINGPIRARRGPLAMYVPSTDQSVRQRAGMTTNSAITGKTSLSPAALCRVALVTVNTMAQLFGLRN